MDVASGGTGLADDLVVEFTKLSSRPKNLIRNPSAEFGLQSWTQTGVEALLSRTLTSLGWGDLETWSAGACPGDHLFIASGDNRTATAHQFIDLCEYNKTIDSGLQSFTLSALLGGFDTNPESFTLSVRWFIGELEIGHPVSIGPITAEDRLHYRGLYPRSTTGYIPRGARYAKVIIDAPVLAGENYAVIDQLALRLDNVTVPEFLIATTPAPAVYSAQPVGRNYLVNGDAERSNTHGWNGTMVPVRYTDTLPHPPMSGELSSPTRGPQSRRSASNFLSWPMQRSIMPYSHSSSPLGLVARATSLTTDPQLSSSSMVTMRQRVGSNSVPPHPVNATKPAA